MRISLGPTGTGNKFQARFLFDKDEVLHLFGGGEGPIKVTVRGTVNTGITLKPDTKAGRYKLARRPGNESPTFSVPCEEFGFASVNRTECGVGTYLDRSGTITFQVPESLICPTVKLSRVNAWYEKSVPLPDPIPEPRLPDPPKDAISYCKQQLEDDAIDRLVKAKEEFNRAIKFFEDALTIAKDRECAIEVLTMADGTKAIKKSTIL